MQIDYMNILLLLYTKITMCLLLNNVIIKWLCLSISMKKTFFISVNCFKLEKGNITKINVFLTLISTFLRKNKYIWWDSTLRWQRETLILLSNYKWNNIYLINIYKFTFSDTKSRFNFKTEVVKLITMEETKSTCKVGWLDSAIFVLSLGLVTLSPLTNHCPRQWKN